MAAFAVFNGVYPAVQRSSDAINNAADTVDDRMKSRIEIIQVSDTGSTVDAWIKNVGSSTIAGIDNSDVFFGIEGDVTRVSYGNDSSPLPYWSYQLEGGGATWKQTGTTMVTIHLASSPGPGTYQLKMVIPNGTFDETVFGVE